MSKERPWEAGPFEQWVIDELDYRKKSLSTGIQGQFTGDLPQYAGPRKAWARVFSNGMVQYPNGNANLISDNDNEWGLAFLSGDGFFDRYGIGSTSPYGVSKQVYGYNCNLKPKYIDASTRPNIPDPGIISIETEIQKSWFAKAKINWTCHSIEQLKAITPYFLTPLQNVIIEFGWNTFDQRSLINLSNFGEILDVWNNHYRRYSQSMPLSKGNYDFLIGQVINFEYTINDNIITGMTEVASRQLLYSGFKKDSKISKQSVGKSTFKQSYKVLVDNIFNSFTSTDNQGNNSAQFQIGSLLSGLENKYGSQFTNIKDHIFSGRDTQKIKYSHERDFDNNNKKGEEFTWLTMDLIVDILNGMKNSDGIKEYTEYFFDLNIDDITIGAHDNLISIKETILIPNPNAPKLNSPYNVYLQNSYQPNPEDAAGGILDNINIFGFTEAEKENIIKTGDSGVDNLNNAYTDKTKHKFFKPEYGKAHSKLMSYVKSNLADKQLHNATGASTKVHRQDLNYILNNWGRTNSRKNTAIPAKDQTFGGTRVPDGLKRGYLKNIYVNLKFLKEVLLTEQNNNIKEVYDVICAEINKSSCNFWELTVVDAPVENGRSTLKIVDSKGPPNRNDANNIYKFEYMTNNSIIKKLNFTTNLSNAQANQIIFKAGTYDYTTSNQLLDYTNVTNLSNSKKPQVVYSDRIIKTKAGEKELNPNPNKPSSRLNTEDIKYYYKLIGKDGKKYNNNESIKFLQVTLFDEKPNPDSRGADTITDFETYDIVDIIMPFEDLVLYMLNDGDLKTNSNIYNAPLRNVEIEISLMGISGIKTFEFFRIANLPPPFNDDVVVFQVMNITHVINENTWETRLKAQLRPAYNLLS